MDPLSSVVAIHAAASYCTGWHTPCVGAARVPHGTGLNRLRFLWVDSDALEDLPQNAAAWLRSGSGVRVPPTSLRGNDRVHELTRPVRARFRMNRWQGPIGPVPGSCGERMVRTPGSLGSLAAAREGASVQTRFEIVWRASPAAAQILLRSTTDANEATISFLAEHARLKRQAAPGELLVRTGDRTRPPLMRQPLTDQGERHIRRPGAPRARTIRITSRVLRPSSSSRRPPP